MSKEIEQVKFCAILMKRLEDAVVLHEDERKKFADGHHAWVSYNSGNKLIQKGASKTQIMASIVQLRRELNVLNKMFDDWGQ